MRSLSAVSEGWRGMEMSVDTEGATDDVSRLVSTRGRDLDTAPAGTETPSSMDALNSGDRSLPWRHQGHCMREREKFGCENICVIITPLPPDNATLVSNSYRDNPGVMQDHTGMTCSPLRNDQWSPAYNAGRKDTEFPISARHRHPDTNQGLGIDQIFGTRTICRHRDSHSPEPKGPCDPRF